jgi:hypothetical protein
MGFRVSNGQKNKTTLSMDHESSYVQPEPVSNLGESFSQSKKEKAYHMTNSSDINFLRSFKTLDVPKGDESRLIPGKKCGQSEKWNLN